MVGQDQRHHGFADRNLDNSTGAVDFVALFDLEIIAENHNAYAVLFEVQREAQDIAREL